MTKVISLEYQEQTVRPTYGGTEIIVGYLLTTECYGVTNRYEVDAQIRGIQSAEPYLSMYGYKPLDNNEETLTEDAITDLLEW